MTYAYPPIERKQSLQNLPHLSHGIGLHQKRNERTREAKQGHATQHEQSTPRKSHHQIRLVVVVAVIFDLFPVLSLLLRRDDDDDEAMSSEQIKEVQRRQSQVQVLHRQQSRVRRRG